MIDDYREAVAHPVLNGQWWYICFVFPIKAQVKQEPTSIK